MKTKIPVHQWTNGGNRVLIVKCVNFDLRSYGDFQWPESGPVKPTKCTKESTCDSGGLFGWPWGVNIGAGKCPIYGRSKWIVFSAPPEQVVNVDGKVKVCAESPADVDAVVVYCGDWVGAMRYTYPGRIGWLDHVSNDIKNIDTVENGISFSKREEGVSFTRGRRSAAVATREFSIALAGSGWGNTGRNAAVVNGSHSLATALDEEDVAAAHGTGSGASAISAISIAASTGSYGYSESIGTKSVAAATGFCIAASSVGAHSISVAADDDSLASAVGRRGIAAISGNMSTIEVGEHCLGAVTADHWHWKVRKGAVVACLYSLFGEFHSKLLDAKSLGLNEGDIAEVLHGKVINIQRAVYVS